MKSVALTVLELLAINAQIFTGSRDSDHAPFSQKNVFYIYDADVARSRTTAEHGCEGLIRLVEFSEVRELLANVGGHLVGQTSPSSSTKEETANIEKKRRRGGVITATETGAVRFDEINFDSSQFTAEKRLEQIRQLTSTDQEEKRQSRVDNTPVDMKDDQQQ